jgi:hypothetical protein
MMVAAALTGLIKQYAFRPADGFDPSLADIAIIAGSVTAVILIGIWISRHRRVKNTKFQP